MRDGQPLLGAYRPRITVHRPLALSVVPSGTSQWFPMLPYNFCRDRDLELTDWCSTGLNTQPLHNRVTPSERSDVTSRTHLTASR